MGHAAKSIGHGISHAVKSVGGFVSGVAKGIAAPYQRLYYDIGHDPVNAAIEVAGFAFGGPLGLRLAEGGVDVAKGHETPGQFARNVGSEYVGQEAGQYAGSVTGSNTVGSAVGGTASGLVQGKGLEKSLQQGAGAGLSTAATSALLGPSDGSTTDAIERQLASNTFNQAFNDLLGNSPTAASSPFAQIASRTTAPAANAAATPSGPTNITGGAIDISGSDVNQPRSKVWNQGSLRVKDALGA